MFSFLKFFDIIIWKFNWIRLHIFISLYSNIIRQKLIVHEFLMKCPCNTRIAINFSEAISLALCAGLEFFCILKVFFETLKLVRVRKNVFHCKSLTNHLRQILDAHKNFSNANKIFFFKFWTKTFRIQTRSSEVWIAR